MENIITHTAQYTIKLTTIVDIVEIDAGLLVQILTILEDALNDVFFLVFLVFVGILLIVLVVDTFIVATVGDEFVRQFVERGKRGAVLLVIFVEAHGFGELRVVGHEVALVVVYVVGPVAVLVVQAERLGEALHIVSDGGLSLLGGLLGIIVVVLGVVGGLVAPFVAIVVVSVLTGSGVGGDSGKTLPGGRFGGGTLQEGDAGEGEGGDGELHLDLMLCCYVVGSPIFYGLVLRSFWLFFARKTTQNLTR